MSGDSARFTNISKTTVEKRHLWKRAKSNCESLHVVKLIYKGKKTKAIKYKYKKQKYLSETIKKDRKGVLQ